MATQEQLNVKYTEPKRPAPQKVRGLMVSMALSQYKNLMVAEAMVAQAKRNLTAYFDKLSYEEKEEYHKEVDYKT